MLIMGASVLVDSYGRRITSLRVSVTNRCNLDCTYCHHEGEECNGREASVEEFIAIISKAAELGVEKVKFSGGEPLLRDDFVSLLSELPDIKEYSLTSNGTLLASRAGDLREAGLDRVNVSLDSLDPKTYGRVTGCNGSTVNRVLDGIDAAVDAGLTPVKLNMVLMKGVNDHEVDDMIRFAAQYEGDVILQLIELMDFNGVGPLRVDMERLEENLYKRASRTWTRGLHRRRKYLVEGAEVEVVRPMDNSEFCANCSRLRVTSDGKLKPCLLRNDNLVSVNGDVEASIKKAVALREPYNKE